MTTTILSDQKMLDFFTKNLKSINKANDTSFTVEDITDDSGDFLNELFSTTVKIDGIKYLFKPVNDKHGNQQYDKICVIRCQN